MGPVLGGCLVAYGSDTYKGCSAIFKRTPSQEEAAIAVGVYKLAVRISIGSGFFGTMFGWIAMLRHMRGGSNGMDIGALAHGVAVRWLRLYTGCIRLHNISTLAILLPIPVGQELLNVRSRGESKVARR